MNHDRSQDHQRFRVRAAAGSNKPTRVSASVRENSVNFCKRRSGVEDKSIFMHALYWRHRGQSCDRSERSGHLGRDVSEHIVTWGGEKVPRDWSKNKISAGSLTKREMWVGPSSSRPHPSVLLCGIEPTTAEWVSVGVLLALLDRIGRDPVQPWDLCLTTMVEISIKFRALEFGVLKATHISRRAKFSLRLFITVIVLI